MGFSHVMYRSIFRKSRVLKEGLFPSARLFGWQRGVSTRDFFAKQLKNEVRLLVGVFGAAVGFSITTMSSEVVSRLKDFNLISCANAVEAFDEDEYSSVEEKKPRNSKRSAQFNFIADAIESATPAVVYIEVCLLLFQGPTHTSYDKTRLYA